MTPGYLLLQSDARAIPLADRSVHCVVTSPPYWGLRDYNVPGQIGLEASPAAFIETMVRVGREIWRVLRDDGTFWMNLGDSYVSNGRGWGGGDNKENPGGFFNTDLDPRRIPGLKPKDLTGIPWRVALALQADGWYLRSDIIWAKPNPMPESVTDRPTKSHEYLFLLSKRERYYWDAEAVREPGSINQPFGRLSRQKDIDGSEDGRGNRFDSYRDPSAGRNLRSVWSIPTESFPGAHFATYPRRLVEPCIKAGTSERGCCPRCGAGWVREVERGELQCPTGDRSDFRVRGDARRDCSLRTDVQPIPHAYYPKTTIAWHPGCTCPPHEPVPAIVLDPFAGSATTIVVANVLDRHGIGLDLSREYLTNQAQRRLERPHAKPHRPARVEPDLPLFREED